MFLKVWFSDRLKCTTSALSLPTIQPFWEYGLRFDIEENFLDDKSNGFDLESSHLRSAPAISRLCLVIAMTTLFLTAQGLAVADSSGLPRLLSVNQS